MARFLRHSVRYRQRGQRGHVFALVGLLVCLFVSRITPVENCFKLLFISHLSALTARHIDDCSSFNLLNELKCRRSVKKEMNVVC